MLRNKEVNWVSNETNKNMRNTVVHFNLEIKAVGIATKGEPTLHSSYNKPSIFKEF